MATAPDLPVLTCKTVKEWEKWLAKNHDKAPGIWFRFFKKDSGQKGVTYAEALDEALCYGWIDSQVQKYDDMSYIRKFTPRGSKSVWSEKNTQHIQRLIDAGKMKPTGMKHVEAAQMDGRWKQAYPAASVATLPEDFIAALNKDKKAKAFFDTLNRANVYAIIWRLHTAVKPETRAKRMATILAMLKKGEKFH